MHNLRSVLLLGAFGLAASCTSQQEAPFTGPNASKDGAPHALVRTETELPGINCVAGGTAILTGLDINDNGVLDPGEETSTAYACNGQGGPPGPASLVRTERVASDPRCAAGGVVIRSGRDDNADGLLQPPEVDDDQIVCDAADCGPSGILDGDVVLEGLAEVTAVLACTRVTGSLTINANAAALSLPTLSQVDGDLTLSGGAASATLAGLTSVGGNLSISNNPELTQLSMAALASVGGNVEVTTNAVLETFNFTALTTVSGASVSFTNNFALPECDARDFGTQLQNAGFAGTFSESGNLNVVCPGEEVICAGDRFITTPEIPVDLQTCTELTGNLVINSGTDLGTVSLPTLHKVGGNIVTGGTISGLDAPQLIEVGGNLSISGSAGSTFALPGLTSVGAVLAVSGDVALNVAAVQSVGGDVIASSGGTLTANAVTTIGGLVVAGDACTIEMRALASIPATLQVGNDANVRLDVLTSLTGEVLIGQRSSFSVPRLTSFPDRVEFQASSNVSAPLVTSIGGSLFIDQGATVTLTSLQSIGNRLDIESTTINLPALTALNEIRLYDPASGSSNVTLGAMTSLATLRIWSDAVLSAPQMTSLGTLQISPSVTTVSLPALDTLNDLIVLGFDDDSASFTLSAIRQIGNIDVRTGFTNLKTALATLQSTTGDFVVDGSTLSSPPSAGEFDLPALTSIGGKFEFFDTPYTSISAPNLGSIAGDSRVSGNVFLETFNLGALTSVGGNVEIRDNPVLSQCDIDTVGANLLGNGFSGSFDVANNSPFSCSGDCTTAGDVTISGSEDIPNLLNCNRIEGSLIINSTTEVSAPDLTFIGGSLTDNAGTTVINLPAVTTIGGGISLSSRQAPTLSSLTSVGGDITLPRSGRLFVDLLTDLSGSISLGEYADFSSTQLQTLGGSLTIGDRGEVFLGALTSIGGNLQVGRQANITLTSLTGVSGALSVLTDASFSGPLLTSVGGDMNVSGNTTLDLPSLDRITGTLNFGASTASLPALTQAGKVLISHHSSAPADLTLGQLTTVTEVLFAAKGTVTANALTSLANMLVSGGVSTVNMTGLQSLTRLRVGFSANGSQFLFPALASMGSLDADAPASNLPTALTALNSVSGDLRFEANGNAAQSSVASLSLPELTSVGGAFKVEDHGDLTSLSAPKLTSVSGNVTITGNTSLTGCDIDTLQTQLVGGGFSGTFTASGNGAACAP